MAIQPKAPTKRICSGRVLAASVAILQMRRSATTSSGTRWSKPNYGPSWEDTLGESIEVIKEVACWLQADLPALQIEFRSSPSCRHSVAPRAPP